MMGDTLRKLRWEQVPLDQWPTERRERVRPLLAWLLDTMPPGLAAEYGRAAIKREGRRSDRERRLVEVVQEAVRVHDARGWRGLLALPAEVVALMLERPAAHLWGVFDCAGCGYVVPAEDGRPLLEVCPLCGDQVGRLAYYGRHNRGKRYLPPQPMRPELEAWEVAA